MRVLSLFDGISCAQESLRQAGIEVFDYVSYEIETKLHSNTLARFPKTKIYTDVMNFMPDGEFDLLVAGSPCQGFSNSGQMKGFHDSRSILFYQFLRILNLVKPKYFMLENVRMKSEFVNIINSELGLKPLSICAGDYSPIRRPRLYWCNFEIGEISQSGIKKSNIIDTTNTDFASPNWHKWFHQRKGYLFSKSYVTDVMKQDKLQTQVARQYANWQGNIVNLGLGQYRFLTPDECAMFHGLPKGYTDHLPKSHAYKALGNGWALQVTSPILSNLKS